MDYNYDKLKKTGLFSLFFFEDFYDSNFSYKDDRVINATSFKQAILPVFESRIKPYFQVGQAVDGFKKFVSDLYDYILLDKKLPKKHDEFIKLNKRYFNIRHRPYFDEMRHKYAMTSDILLEEGRFFTDTIYVLHSLYDELCWQLKISNDKNAAIMDCEFQLAKMGYESLSDSVNQSMEAYRLLRVECGKIIGTLPMANSIQEVIQLKERRYNDLHNLRQELSHLEDEIRKGDSAKAIEKAANDISKASKALSRGNIASEVSKWTNAFMIPAATGSLLMNQPPFSYFSGALSIVGSTANFISKYIEDKYRWFEIMI